MRVSGGIDMNIQEIEQFLNQYQIEQNESELWLENRLQEIKSVGEYYPTTEELVFGARVAWRNSNKCIGRLFWQSLHVVDARDLLDEEDIFRKLLEHIDYATNSGKIRPTITVFASDRVRIWNHQLIRYAGYETELGVIGDSHSIAFTQVCETLGWKSERTAFDVLPLVIQVYNSSRIYFRGANPSPRGSRNRKIRDEMVCRTHYLEYAFSNGRH